MKKMDKIIGIGNALVDILAILEDDGMLEAMQLPKGGMTLIDAEKRQQIVACFSQVKTRQSTGGSAGNVICALSRMGAAAGFVGKVGSDAYGDFFSRRMKRCGAGVDLIVTDDSPTGVASAFITPDGERTFATFLGAAAMMKADELTLEMFKGYAYLFVEGYLVQDHDLMLRIIELAKEAGLQVCLDLASYNIVEEEQEFFSLLMNKYVDIVFANEEEARVFTGKEPEEALDVLAGLCSVAIVKMGAEGAWIRKGTEKVKVEAVSVKKVADTTGSGDFFAAGFLYGLTGGCSLEKCGRIGALLAGEVVKVVGTTLSAARWRKIKEEL